MIPSLSYDRTNWFFKFCECLLTAIALLNLAMIPLELLPRSFWKTYGQYFEYVLSGTVAVALLSSILYTWFWHRRERMGGINGGCVMPGCRVLFATG